MKSTFRRVGLAVVAIVVIVYEAVLLALLLGESGFLEGNLRATDQVLLLLVLLFLPLLLYTMQKVTLRVSGHELALEMRELEGRVDDRLEDVHRNLAGQVTTAEQALFSLIGGPVPDADGRLVDRRLIVGAKDFPEQRILGEVLAQAIEGAGEGWTVERRIPNGGTLRNFADVRHGRIDAYVEYTATGCQLLDLRPGPGEVCDPAGDQEKLATALDERTRERGVRWRRPLPLRNDYCLVVPTAYEGIETIADLAASGRRKILLCDMEFYQRPDGFQGLVRRYDLRFEDVRIVSYAARYPVEDPEGRGRRILVQLGFMTDAELLRRDLRVLRDDAGFFLPYRAVPVFRTSAWDRLPEAVRDAVDALGDLPLGTEEMRGLLRSHARRGEDRAIAADLAASVLRTWREARRAGR